MISTHVYAAYLIGTPDVELDVKGGSITLDAGWSPHVQGAIVVYATGAVLEQLDPRDSVRIRVEVDATFPTVTQARTFDLSLRERSVQHRDGSVTLTVASDEALLLDYAPLEDDTTPFTHQDSLRDVIDYVLDTVISGAALESTPTDDADLTTSATVRNILTNPCAHTDLTGWSAFNLASFVRQTSAAWVANASGTAFRLNGDGSSANGRIDLAYNSDADQFAGRTFLFRARHRNGSGTLSGPSSDASTLIVYYSTNTGGYTELGRMQGSTVGDGQADVHVVASFPAGTTRVLLRLMHGYASTNSVFWSDVRISEYTEDPTDTGYFDGSTTDTAQYLYEWTDTTGTSESNREAIDDRPPDALVWRAGESALDFLMPLFQAAGFRLVCNESREWTLRNAGYLASGAVNVRYAVNMVDATDDLTRDEWYDAAVVPYRWTDRQGIEQLRYDTFALNDPYTRCVLLERDTPYPGPGFAEYAVNRAQGRGRVVQATTVADWDLHAEQACTIVVPDADTQTGKTERVVFSFDDDRVTITARTTDTPEDAVDLLAGTINALAGTINAL